MADEKRPKNWWLRTVIAAFLSPPVYIIAKGVLFRFTVQGTENQLLVSTLCVVGLVWLVVFTFPWWRPLDTKK